MNRNLQKAIVDRAIEEAERTDKSIVAVLDELRQEHDDTTTCLQCGARATDALSASLALCHRCVQGGMVRELQKRLRGSHGRTAPPENPRRNKKRRRR